MLIECNVTWPQCAGLSPAADVGQFTFSNLIVMISALWFQ